MNKSDVINSNVAEVCSLESIDNESELVRVMAEPLPEAIFPPFTDAYMRR